MVVTLVDSTTHCASRDTEARVLWTSHAPFFKRWRVSGRQKIAFASSLTAYAPLSVLEVQRREENVGITASLLPMFCTMC